MLRLSGFDNFYYLPLLHDMRYKRPRLSEKLDSILTELTATKHQLVETQRELADTNILLASEREEKQKLKEEKRQYEKERCDLLEEISSLRSDLYSGTKSQQTNRSGSHVNANDGEDDFDGTDDSLPKENRKGYTEAAKSSESCVAPHPQSSAEKSPEVNDDETWERFQTYFGHRKTYMWCLVNRKAGIVIFFYEDTVDKYGKQKSGGRNRAVLKDFLGDAKLSKRPKTYLVI